MRHCTEMKVEKQFVDTHGQNEVAFGFCHLLGFGLMPRLKNIYAQSWLALKPENQMRIPTFNSFFQDLSIGTLFANSMTK